MRLRASGVAFCCLDSEIAAFGQLVALGSEEATARVVLVPADQAYACPDDELRRVGVAL